jgi:predicted RNA-binding Zn-ribbon protein involved in translation (DUF1610 family)
MYDEHTEEHEPVPEPECPSCGSTNIQSSKTVMDYGDKTTCLDCGHVWIDEIKGERK